MNVEEAPKPRRRRGRAGRARATLGAGTLEQTRQQYQDLAERMEIVAFIADEAVFLDQEARLWELLWEMAAHRPSGAARWRLRSEPAAPVEGRGSYEGTRDPYRRLARRMSNLAQADEAAFVMGEPGLWEDLWALGTQRGIVTRREGSNFPP